MNLYALYVGIRLNHTFSFNGNHVNLFYPSLYAIQKLPVSQAHGDIRIYEVSLSYKSGTVVLLNVSTAEPRDLLVCDKTQCYLNSSLKDVSSAVVSAYNSCGATVPSHLPFSIPGIFCPDFNKSIESGWEYQTLNSDVRHALSIVWNYIKWKVLVRPIVIF